METIIIICLLIIIALLLKDKIVISKNTEHKPKTKGELSDIMGKPKPEKRLSAPKSAFEGNNPINEQNLDNFEVEIAGRDAELENPQEVTADAIGNMPDFDEEEEEWYGQGISNGDNGFAQGVTFEELSAVGMLLQNQKLEQSQKETAVAIVQKIQGTELFSLLENSIEGASHKIAQLLDGALSETMTGTSALRKNDAGDFDIGEFV